jgi:acyl carrier protein
MTDPALLDQAIAEALSIPPSDAAQAAYAETPSWDSVAHLMLMNDIEQRFGLSLAGSDVSEMTDYQSIRRILGERYGVRFDD